MLYLLLKLFVAIVDVGIDYILCRWIVFAVDIQFRLLPSYFEGKRELFPYKYRIPFPPRVIFGDDLQMTRFPNVASNIRIIEEFSSTVMTLPDGP